MSSAAQRRRATLQELLAIPEEERFHELLDGELIQKATPSFEHGDAQGAISHLLFPFRRQLGGRGPRGWWFASKVEVQLGEQVCRPDVSGWRRERVPERPKGGPLTIVPDWTCEILSTSNKRIDLVKKKRIYHQHRVLHYWIVDPDVETLTVHRWHSDGYLEVLAAERGQRVRAEPFDAIEIDVGIVFGDDETEAQSSS
jgi:Uma2 family endonuclease